MPTLNLVITDAGIAALTNAQNTGTLPLLISQVAIGTGRWEPDPSATELMEPLKVISTVGGSAVADDTIHVTVTDDSADAYSLGEFGLLTDGGVLFAIYSSPDGITDKAAEALLLEALDIQFAGLPPNSVTVGDAGFFNPPASESQPGVAKIADQPTVDQGDNDMTIVSPKKLRNASTAEPTANRLMRRDAFGRAQVVEPSEDGDIATKGYVDSRLSGGYDKFPSGTRMLFQQSTAPTGWTKVTDHNDKALRVVSGTANYGGSVAFSAAMSARTVSSTAAGGWVGEQGLTIAQLAPHSHTIYGSGYYNQAANFATINGTNNTINKGTSSAGYGYSHSHPFTPTPHSHTLDMAVQYVDVIIAIKN